jgi:hypothetical protein
VRPVKTLFNATQPDPGAASGWRAQELLRTLAEAKITAREAASARTRLKAGWFLAKILEECDRSVSSIPRSR